MSNFLAIATVTATLQRILQASVLQDVAGAEATTLLPDESNQNNLPDIGVNIFLYQVTPNTAWRNTDLPTRSGAGLLVQRPRVALDLHYLLTFYGDDGPLLPQRVLGSVARTLHARPIITHEMIEATLTAAELESSDHYLLPSNLADEVELVKFTPAPFSLEELSKLWSVLLQTPYVLSMAYTGTVVLIEADDEVPRRSLPVRRRSITVFPFRRGIIEKVVSPDGETAPIVFGGTALLQGTSLGGPIDGVRVGVATVPATTVSQTEVSVGLTAGALRAGIFGVQIVYTDGTTSNVAVIVLRPTITVGAPVLVNPPGTSAEIPITFTPAVDRSQQVTLYLNELNPPLDGSRPPFAYTIEAPSDNGITNPSQDETNLITFTLADYNPAIYLVYAQVAGAESVLEWDETLGYTGPTVTI